MTNSGFKTIVYVVCFVTLAIGFTSALIALSDRDASISQPSSDVDYWYRRVDQLEDENFELRRQNSYLQRYKTDVDEMDARIAGLKSKGYKPDELVVRYLQREARKVNIPVEFADQVLQTESSYWSNTNGLAGEFGGFQILPSTLLYYLDLLGVDTTRVNSEDYADLRTNTEWAYFFFWELRQNKKKLDWTFYNRGFSERDVDVADVGGK